MVRTRVVILGAAGRDFHDFNVRFREDPAFDVVAFTATQIPDIAGRRYPPELAGPLYPNGIPIVAESELPDLVRVNGVRLVVFAYSDVSHEHVMHVASTALAAGASFTLLGPDDTMLTSARPVVSVCAVRTGAGKSPVSRFVARHFRENGRTVAVVRHPMPYGDLAAQAVQRFAKLEDLDRAKCTIEEREEYEPHIREGAVVYAGVDYARILRLAEEDAEVIVWDGGNNDLPFFRPWLHLVVADPHRAGHELRYHPGETNVRMADVVVISKVDTARPEDIAKVERNVGALNPRATLVHGGLRMTMDGWDSLEGKRVVVVEDGPTLTHGGMAYGAGTLVARRERALVVDARPFAVGSLAETYRRFPHLDGIVPAMGYSDAQVRELSETLEATPADLVLDASPVDLARLVKISKPIVNVRYVYDDHNHALTDVLARFEKEAFA